MEPRSLRVGSHRFRNAPINGARDYVIEQMGCGHVSLPSYGPPRSPLSQVRSEKRGALQYGNKLRIGSFDERGDYSKEIRVTETEMPELGKLTQSC